MKLWCIVRRLSVKIRLISGMLYRILMAVMMITVLAGTMTHRRLTVVMMIPGRDDRSVMNSW